MIRNTRGKLDRSQCVHDQKHPRQARSITVCSRSETPEASSIDDSVFKSTWAYGASGQHANNQITGRVIIKAIEGNSTRSDSHSERISADSARSPHPPCVGPKTQIPMHPDSMYQNSIPLYSHFLLVIAADMHRKPVK